MKLTCAIGCLWAVLVLFPSTAAWSGNGSSYSQEKKGGDRGGKRGAKGGAAEQDSGMALEAWGTLKEVKGTPFFTLDYTKIEGGKGSKHSVFIKVDEGAEFYTDKLAKVTDLKEGDSVWLLGRPVEHETPGKNGVGGGMDRQLQNVSAVVSGDGQRPNRKYKDAKDPKLAWCEATIAKAGPAITVNYQGGDYKVAMGKTAPVMVRGKAGDAKSLKNGVQVAISAEKSDEKPDTKSPSDAKKDSFLAKKVVLLDKRLVGTLYPMLLE